MQSKLIRQGLLVGFITVIRSSGIKVQVVLLAPRLFGTYGLVQSLPTIEIWFILDKGTLSNVNPVVQNKGFKTQWKALFRKSMVVSRLLKPKKVPKRLSFRCYLYPATKGLLHISKSCKKHISTYPSFQKTNAFFSFSFSFFTTFAIQLGPRYKMLYQLLLRSLTWITDCRCKINSLGIFIKISPFSGLIRHRWTSSIPKQFIVDDDALGEVRPRPVVLAHMLRSSVYWPRKPCNTPSV